MPQSLVICIDNSEYTRNGDFGPSRLLQEQENANEIVRTQLQSNPENDVALLTTAGIRPELLSPLSRAQVSLQKKLYSVETCGMHDPITALRIAQLVLKNRPGRNHQQRVIFFLGSPTDHIKGADRIGSLGKGLRKANINLDMVVFGTTEEIDQTKELFKPLVTAMGDSCQFVTVTADRSLTNVVQEKLHWLSGAVQETSPTMGHTSNEDPELMMAIQMSLNDMNQRGKGIRDDNTSATAVTSKAKANLDFFKETETQLRKTRDSSHHKSQVNPGFPPRVTNCKSVSRNDLTLSQQLRASTPKSGSSVLSGKHNSRHSTSSSWNTASSATSKSSLKFSSKVATGKSNSQIRKLQRSVVSKDQRSMKVGSYSSIRLPKQSESRVKPSVLVNTKKIQDLITAKVRLLSAVDDSKVNVTVPLESSSSKSSLSRTQSSSRPNASNVRNLKTQSSAKIKTIRMRLVLKKPKSVAKASPSKQRLSAPTKSVVTDVSPNSSGKQSPLQCTSKSNQKNLTENRAKTDDNEQEGKRNKKDDDKEQ